VRPVIWSPEAVRDVRDIHDYIEQFHPVAARRIAAELYSSTDILKHFPELGRPAVNDTREWGSGKYVIVYRTGPTETRILRVWHGAQDRPR
jgi:plasmid stabilization system protein ParE